MNCSVSYATPLLPLPSGRRKPRRTATAHVLVPGPFGGLVLFHRRGSSPIYGGTVVADAGHLRALIQKTRGYSFVVLCGSRYLEPVVRAVDNLADVYLVPLHWLRGIPRDQPELMAGTATTLVTAHHRGPIRPIYRWHQPELPF